MAKKTRTELDMESGQSSQGMVLRFGAAALHVSRRELFVAGQKIDLEPKPLDLLLLLLRQPGELVSKEALFAEIWAGRIVTDSVLTRCVAKLRQALADDGLQIETVHGYGYRFTGELSYEDVVISVPDTYQPPLTETPSIATPSLAPAAAETRAATLVAESDLEPPPYRIEFLPHTVRAPHLLTPYRKLRWLAAALAATLLIGGFAAITAYRAGRAPSIAVLPFANLSPEGKARDYLAAGIHENILTHLARIGGLKVISRTSVMRYEGKAHNIRDIARALEVDHVLEGSVQQVGQRLLVNAQLIDAQTDHHLWAEAYDRPLTDLLKIQSELAERVARSVGMRLTPGQSSAIRSAAAANSGTYDVYMQARQQERDYGMDREALFRAEALLNRAVAEEPGFALAHAALSRVNSYLYWFAYDPAPERRAQAKAEADKALRLDSELAEGYHAQGLYRAAGFRDYIGAVQAYQRALELQPNNADFLRSMASAHRRQGQWGDAVAVMERALELDPQNPSLLEDLAQLYHRALRQYAKAAALQQHLLKLTPDDLSRRLESAYLQLDWKGDLKPLRELVSQIPLEQAPATFHIHYRLAMWEGRFLDAAHILEQAPSEWLEPANSASRTPKSVSIALAYDFAGEMQRAKAFYAKAQPEVEAEIALHPDSGDLHLLLADVFAGLGDFKRAERELVRAFDLTAKEFDAVSHAMLLSRSSITWLRIQQPERALADLERSLQIPYGQSAHFVRALPYWKSLRGHPRFEALTVVKE